MRFKVQISISIALLFAYAISVAQTNKIDSLKEILRTLSDTTRIDCLGQLGVQFLFVPARDSTIYYGNLIYQESKKIDYKHGLASACMLKAAIANHFYNDFGEMKKMASEALNWFSQTPNQIDVGIANWQMAVAQCRGGNYDDALLNAKLCYDWSRRTNNTRFRFSSLEIMTDIYRETGEYDKLFDAQDEMAVAERTAHDTSEYSDHELWVLGIMYKMLGEYSTAIPFWRQLFIVKGVGFDFSWNQMEYAELLTLANQPDSALYYYNKFDSAKAETKDLRFYLISKGEFLLFLKKYSVALPYFLRGLGYHRQLSDVTQVNRTLLDIARTYLALENGDSAIVYARKGLAIALQTKSEPYIRDGYELLSMVYDHMDKPDSGNSYFRRYVSARDSVLNDQMKGRVVTYNFQQKIVALNQQKLTQLQQLQKEKTNRNILLTALIAGILLGVFLLRNIQLKRKKDQLQHLMIEANSQLENRRKEQQLSAMQQQKTELEMQALRAQMNPHFIFNSLNSINMFILENNKLQASEYLSKFSRLVRLILQNSQEALIPLEKELEALELYLELESLRFQNKFEYNISTFDDVETSGLKVPPLIIQPYVENAIWHGLMHKKDKGHVDVQLSKEEEFLVCKIIDDGVGRKGAAEMKNGSSKHRSMGIKITENRIANMQMSGATQTVQIKDLVYADGTAAGTEVVLKIPITFN
jgi:sensor histidine kinase YesM